MKKPTKSNIYFNVAAMLLYIAVAALYFAAGDWLGWFWTASSLLWVATITLSIKTYRRGSRTYEAWQQTNAAWERRYSGPIS